MNRLVLALGTLVVALTLAACSPATAAQPSGLAATPGPNDITIAARDMQFVQRDVTVAAGTAFTILFDNQEGAPHNVSLYDASGASISKGEIFGGPAQRSQAVPALGAGNYTYKCDLHPDMTGTLTAK
jgi:plastocyanin